MRLALPLLRDPASRFLTRRAQLELLGEGTGARLALSTNRAAVPDVQRVLAVDPDVGVRSWLCYHHRLAPDVQRVLAADPDVEVRARLAANPRLVPDVLGLLLADPSREVLSVLDHYQQVRVTRGQPVRFLQMSVEGRALLSSALEGLDAPARAALAPTWEGTLDDLVTAIEALSPG